MKLHAFATHFGIIVKNAGKEAHTTAGQQPSPVLDLEQPNYIKRPRLSQNQQPDKSLKVCGSLCMHCPAGIGMCTVHVWAGYIFLACTRRKFQTSTHMEAIIYIYIYECVHLMSATCGGDHSSLVPLQVQQAVYCTQVCATS